MEKENTQKNAYIFEILTDNDDRLQGGLNCEICLKSFNLLFTWLNIMVL